MPDSDWWKQVAPGPTQTDLLRSHAELRAIVRLAGLEIKRLNFGKADSELLKQMRKVLREASALAKRFNGR